MKIVIVAGGTGGHIYPGIAIAEALKENPSNQILFIGGREGLEGELVRREGFELKLIHARALLRKISYQAISAPFVMVIGFFEALGILRSFRPEMVIVTGGYVSFPVIVAAILLKIPFALHEQNVLPGMTNKLWHNRAKIVLLSFAETQRYMKGTVTGNPVRKKILAVKRTRNPGKTVTIIGGSQGARSINRALVSHLEELKEIEIFHIIGKRDYEAITSGLERSRYPHYHPLEYVHDMESLLGQSDLAVSRAGATAIAELLALGIPSVLIPFPFSAEGHQDLNAAVLKEAGAAEVLSDSAVNELAEKIISLTKDENKLNMMSRAAQKMARRDAAQKIAGLINAAG